VQILEALLSLYSVPVSNSVSEYVPSWGSCYCICSISVLMRLLFDLVIDVAVSVVCY